MKANHILIVLIAAIFFISTGISYGDEEIDYYSAENIYKFAEYLYQDKDFIRSAKEYERYLLISPNKTDIALYRLGLCYRNAGDTQKAVNAFQKLKKDYPDSVFRFPTSYQIAYSYYISNQHDESIQYINLALRDTQNADETSKLHILMAYNYLIQRQWKSSKVVLDMLSPTEDEVINHLAIELNSRSVEGINLNRKNRFLASILSAIIPGTGKMYCGQYGNGIFSFATVSSTGLIAWSGFREDGIRSIKGWVFGGLCAIFYSGNVYGSGISALVYNRQLEDEIIMRLPSLPNEW
jgi:TM2 domain-containing membrane protein YozV